MTKLTINHLAPYLSHRLKGIVIYGHGGVELCTLMPIDGRNNECSIDSFLNGTYPVKPTLRPLSDLTKEITHRGETFVPIIELAREFHILSKYTVTSYRDVNNYDEYGIEVKCCVENDESRYSCFSIHGGEMILHNEYRIVQKLHEWMFDTSDLIESGLAIDVNTLESNPYEK